MSRPLRLEFAGALYHVTSRGDRKEPIFLDDSDRLAWLDILGKACDRFNFVIYSFCQMTNHYHLMIETAEDNLSCAMRHLNGVYSQYFNRKHKLVGHLFQGRYKAILVEKETYLMELSRYIVLNPVRAGFSRMAEDWKWSSYAYMVTDGYSPDWLRTESLLAHFGPNRKQAVESYRRFVMDGAGTRNPLNDVSHQLFLGGEDFVNMHRHLGAPDGCIEVPRPQRRGHALELCEYESRFPDRDEAMAKAYATTAFSMREIARHFRVSCRTVSRAVQSYENI